MNKQEYVTALRELADFVENKPFPDSWKGWFNSQDSFSPPQLSFYTKSRSDFGKIALAIGTYTKDRGESYTGANRELGCGAKIELNADRDVVCKKVVVGKRLEPAVAEVIIPAKPEREVDIVEWECPESFGMLAKEENVLEEKNANT